MKPLLSITLASLQMVEEGSKPGGSEMATLHVQVADFCPRLQLVQNAELAGTSWVMGFLRSPS